MVPAQNKHLKATEKSTPATVIKSSGFEINTSVLYRYDH